MEELNKKVDLVIELCNLALLDCQLLLVLLAEFTKREKNLDVINKLFHDTEYSLIDRDCIEEWLNKYTPLKYNPKKKRFVLGNSNIWKFEEGLKSSIFLSKAKLEELNSIYGFSELSRVAIARDLISDQIVRINEKLSISNVKISADDIDAIENISDKEIIKRYLAANPAPDSMGKFGVPQSKYRYGTYGLGSMEYNPWAR